MNTTLPVETVRAAIAAEDWDAALAALDAHDTALREAFAQAVPPSAADCEALLAEQHALLLELGQARDATADALRRLNQDRRGVNAYLGAGG